MLKKTKKIIVIALVAGFAAIFVAASTSKDFKIVKNLDLFFAAFRELNNYYVDEIDADKIVPAGINGMLAQLDPYTDFLPEEDLDEFDILTTGEYSGIGALIGQHGDFIQVSEVYKGFSADKAGLVSGDIILSIDGTSLKGKSTSAASNMLKGEQGSAIEMKVVKIKTSDTLNIKLTRDKVHISGITYSGFLSESIGYIELSSFTQNCQKDFKAALKTLEKDGKLKSLVIDLRGNTGGLIDGAIDIVGMFVPKGTEVVCAKGRVKDFEYKYKTSEEPVDTIVPIVVLVNGGSASASEIVAGALQDLDRAVILGTRTYGKGLVQTVRPIGYNSKIKITTAKYYIPSGRCIQAYNFAERNEDGSVAMVPDSLKKEFATAHGRKVFDGGGITPDIDIKSTEYSDIAVSLILRNLISDYAIKYFANHNSISSPETFKITDDDYSDFVKFLSNKEYDYQTKAEALAKSLAEETKKEKYDNDIQKAVDSLNSRIAHDKQKDLQIHKKEIAQLISEEIVGKYYYQAGRARAMLADDNQLDEALKTLSNSDKYNKILLKNK